MNDKLHPDALDQKSKCEKLFKKVVLLQDGRYGYVFSENAVGCKGGTRFTCHVCQRTCVGYKMLITHSTHPGHTSNLLLGHFLPNLFTRIRDTKPGPDEEDQLDEVEDVSASNTKESDIDIVPGEPVPPGMEGIVEQQCQIQGSFDAYTAGPLIGLEYIVELLSDDQSEPRYICLLCEKKGDPRSVLVHVTSYNHYLKYICCFFRSVGNKLNMMPKTIHRRALNSAVLKVAEAIEKHYGRLKPTSANFSTFSTKKYEILREIDERDHFRETPNTTFLELVTAEKMKEYDLDPVVKESPLAVQKAEEEKKAEQLRIERELAWEKKRGRGNVPPKLKKSNGKDTDDISDNVQIKVEKDELNPKKLSIALKKPERAIPGVKTSEVQNPAMSQLGSLPPLKSESTEPEENPPPKENVNDNDDDSDDVIILPDDGQDTIEVKSLSTISDSSIKSRSRSRSWNRSRRTYSKERWRRSSRSRDRVRGRSRDLGRDHSRGRSWDRFSRRDRSRDRSRDRNKSSRDRRNVSHSRLNALPKTRNRRQTTRDLRSDLEERRSPVRRYRSTSRERRDDKGRDNWRRDDRGPSPTGSSKSIDRDRGRNLDHSRSCESDLLRERTSREVDRRRLDYRYRRDDHEMSDKIVRDRFYELDDWRVDHDRLRELDRVRDFDKDLRDLDSDRIPERGRRRSPEYLMDRRKNRDFESQDRLHQIQTEREKKAKWEAFQKELFDAEEEITNSYKYYQLRPEKHPLYPDEWKAFWNRRYKEIQLTGQDANTYDYKPEWILFWQKKMKELQDTELASKKDDVKRRHKMDSADEPLRFGELQDISPPTPENTKDVTVQDIKKTWKELTGSEITTAEPPPLGKHESGRISPWEDQFHGTKRPLSPWDESGLHSPPPYDRNKRFNTTRERKPTNQSVDHQERQKSYREPVPPIIHCLRMLSVIEHQLGMQGPKVIELLTQALALEKTRPSGSMMLLENKDVYLFFETIVEKLRGQFMVGLVPKYLVATTKSSIKSVRTMLEANPLKPEIFEPVTIPGVGAVDKVAVAQKIASFLVSSGRTNLSQEELEQLINAVVGMANSDNISADSSADKFFSQLNIKNSNASSHINNILSSMITTAQESLEITSKDSPPAICTEEKPTTTNEEHVEKEEVVIPGLGNDISEEPRAASPFSLRKDTGANPIGPEVVKMKNITNYDVEEEDDEDDYSFEDVFQAAAQKVKQTELENKKESVDNPDGENSQTQSSFSSITADSVKAVSDLFKSLINKSVVKEPPAENPADQMLANIASLSQPLTLPKDTPITTAYDQNSSLVETIKNSLVESLNKDSSNNSSRFVPDIKEIPKESREPGRALDPRIRAQWDPTLRDWSGQDTYGENSKSWEEKSWNPEYGLSNQSQSCTDSYYHSEDIYGSSDDFSHSQGHSNRGHPSYQQSRNAESTEYGPPQNYRSSQYSTPYGQPQQPPQFRQRGGQNVNFRSPGPRPLLRNPMPRPWAPPSVRPSRSFF